MPYIEKWNKKKKERKTKEDLMATHGPL